MYLMQNWYTLSDADVEDVFNDSYAMRSFMHIDTLTEQVADATTLLHFRHLIEDKGIGKIIFDDIEERCDKACLIMHGGIIVDATIISA
jgi:transposase, IS5 family